VERIGHDIAITCRTSDAELRGHRVTDTSCVFNNALNGL
jgi:hypothetical protein